MVRNLSPTALDRSQVDEVLDLARRAPSAGNTQAVGFIVLDTPATRSLYWDITLAPERRPGFRWPGLLTAPVLVLVTTSAEAYVARYGEDDKASIGLGDHESAWPVPYWWVDAGAVVQNLLLLCVDRGWGACLFGPFNHEAAVASAVGLEPDRRIVATVAVGLADPMGDQPGRSASRSRPDMSEVIRRPGRPDA